MEGLDLDAPPPKTRSIELDRWSSEDPVGTPHPETFRVTARLRGGPLAKPGILAAQGRWGIGSLEAGKAEAFTPWRDLGEIPIAAGDVPSGRSSIATIDVDTHQAHLYLEERWPYLFEARVRLRDEISGRLLAEDEAKLPIEPGG